ncbi:ABC transporter permease [Phocaeicola sp.]
MNIFLNIKLISRSWWRNKLFFVISLFSLTVGLGCTNLLMTFFIHEYNIEKQNEERHLIYALRQDSPMEEGIKVAYSTTEAATQVKEKYAEVIDMLRMNEVAAKQCKYNETTYGQPLFICADPTLNNFFSYTVLEGNLEEVLTMPDKVAVSETFARKLFGSRSGIGEVLEITGDEDEIKNYQVAAILEERPQSFLHFDLLTSIQGQFWGGPTLLKLQPGASATALQEKIKKDKIPTLVPDVQYYIDPIKDMYFNIDSNSKQQQLPYIQQSDVQLLYIGLISSLLVLVIACFNYTNLSLSRTLQQLKMIHIEKLMGAKLKEIRTQLFCDAALTVLIAFLLSLLLINDLLPWFNELLSAHLSFSFFFSWQVLPLLLLFIFIMAVVPGIYISRKLSRQTLSEYRQSYTGRKKQQLIWILVTTQFLLSIALVYATTVAENQMGLLKARAYQYENTIEIGAMFGTPLAPFHQKLKQIDGIESMTLSMSSVLNSWLRELPIEQPDGSTKRHYMIHIPTDTTFLSTMRIRQIAGPSPAQALREYSHPVFINENYARLLNVDASKIGHNLREFNNIGDTLSIIAGIIENFPFNSLEEEVAGQQLSFVTESNLAQVGMFLQIRLAPQTRKETLAKIEKLWKEMNDDKELQYVDMHRKFMERNKKLITLSRILISYSLIALLLTCFGLFGISWYAVRHRTREIAVRKVHGAGNWRIVWLLNRSFLWQILAAYIVAIPITWWLMQHWLEQFAYRVSSTWWDFLSPILIITAVTVITVTIHSYWAARGNPVNSLKIE